MTTLGRYTYESKNRGKKLVIFGAGETARIAFRGFLYDSPYNFMGFVIDDQFAESHPREMYGFPVFTLTDYVLNSDVAIFVAFSARNLSQDRQARTKELLSKGFDLASYVSSRAFVDTDVHIGQNVLVLENNTLQSEVMIGDGTFIWSGNHIGHRTKIGQYNFLSSHVCVGGMTNIGNQNYFGMNCTVRDGVKIRDEILIGSNSFVNKDIDSPGVYVGTPAKILDGRDPRKSV